MKKNVIIAIGSLFWLMTCACGETAPENGNQEPPPQEESVAARNLTRAM